MNDEERAIGEMDIDDLMDGWDDESEVTDNESEAEEEYEEQTSSEEDSEEEEEMEEPEEESGEEEEEEEEEESEEEETESHYETDSDGNEYEMADADQYLKIKYMGEDRFLNGEEAVEYAQKGLDYDRIRRKYDALKSFEGKENQIDFLQRVADFNGCSVEEFMDKIEIGMIQKQKNMTEAEAKVELMKQKLPKEKSPQEKLKDKVRGDFEAFRDSSFGNKINPKDIPSDVWKLYGDGSKMTLLEAYLITTKKASEKKTRIKQQNEKNKKRSAGSKKKSTGNKKIDPLFEGWEF